MQDTKTCCCFYAHISPSMGYSVGTRIDIPLVLARASCSLCRCLMLLNELFLYSTKLRYTNIAGNGPLMKHGGFSSCRAG